MKTTCLGIFAIYLSLTFTQGQDIDKELATLAEKLAVPIKEHSTKKITVLDFADLHGVGNELGKYIAEELTVDFVMGKREFAVLDRANLRKILAEHKLTAKGLVNPENAKKLGQFAGVDALVLGTIIPKGQTVSLTAKVITTDTAEVIGAARAEFKMDDNIRELLSHATQSDSNDDGDTETKKTGPPAISKSFGDLRIIYERFTGMQDGSIIVSLILQNASKNKSIAVAMYAEPDYLPPAHLRCSLIGADGTECSTPHEDDLTGIRGLRARPSMLTEIKPGDEIRPTIKFSPRGLWSENLTSLRLQAEIVLNSDYSENQYANYRVDANVFPHHCTIQNLVLDIPVARRK